LSLINELKRRSVLRVGLAYVVGAWLIIQVVETIFPVYGLSDGAIRLVITLLAIGLLLVVVLAWAFELTPEGLKKDKGVDRSHSISGRTGKKLDQMIMVVLALALGYFTFDKFVLDSQREAQLQAQKVVEVEEARQEGRTEALVESYGDKSIAVLPFVNMSPDPDQAFFADGIAEELLNLLATIPNLRVTSRSSSFMFRGDALDLPEVAAKLNVAHLLEGSVRKAGNQVRITVQLIEARSDTHLWSEIYDRPLDDIFAIQDEVAKHVVEQLRLTLLGEPPKAQPVNLDAYALVLEARQIVSLLREDEYSKAEELLKEALRIDPDYIDALVKLQHLYWVQHQAAWPERQDELTALIEEFRSKVLKIDPDNAATKSGIAWDKRTRENDLDGAARLYEQAAQVEPSHVYVLIGSGRLALEIGRMDLAIPVFEYLVERDPMTLWNYDNLAKAYTKLGRYEEALRQYSMASSLNEQAKAMWETRLVMLLMGDPAGANRELEQLEDEYDQVWVMSMALHDLDRKDESAEAFQRLRELEDEFLATYKEDLGETVTALHPVRFAIAHAWTGKPDEAFHYLRLQAEQKEGIRGNITSGPFFRRLHDDPRWLPFLREFGLTPEQLAEIEFNPRLPDDLPIGK
jgi:adenylate cyclase